MIDHSMTVVPVLVFHFGALWFILRGDLLYVLPCAILFLCFLVFLAFRLPRLGKRELILLLFVRSSICACLDLSVSSSSWCLGRAAVCDCGTPWTFLLPFLTTMHADCRITFMLYSIFSYRRIILRNKVLKSLQTYIIYKIYYGRNAHVVSHMDLR